MDVDLLLRRAQPPEEPWKTSLEEPFPGQDTSSSEEESRARVMKLVERILAVDKPRRITGMMAEDPSQGKIPELRSIHMFPSNSTPSSAGSTSNVPLLRNRDDILIDSINPHDQGLDNDRDFVHPPDPTQHFHQLQPITSNETNHFNQPDLAVPPSNQPELNSMDIPPKESEPNHHDG
ncbi:hypothetical protein PCANC_07952 [Puccinia coronata f. sp. avenae]|uniref:Uncharacterized protein n=1 Tax=Puccinia coronata f. sp. avenae TaxID=200324 RepID=A0A2N5SR11_9BASI|nr:hypothetical protein PCANC_24964 [Puccinia coronata f. sp. avenae]PLW15661.1 hypothetical protein PCASD_17780 [Puccinia coronata f. sp. avenae]PLW36716.1 hypothetical protein PCASD_08703 [Puccinia coronata f. sp. avenae]PLW42823.1 hypothetical protein PCANC_07952 [Puccinia coronata f. sp. avenae]